MAMSRKHYVEMARAIRRELTAADEDTNPIYGAIRRSTIKILAYDFAAMAERDNQSFRLRQFLGACGMADEPERQRYVDPNSDSTSVWEAQR